MVLALPILLFIMALYINFGVAASWKVRALSVARHSAFGMRWPRTGPTDPKPAYFAGDAQMSRAAERVPSLDDPRANHPVIRGPLPGQNDVPIDLLDPADGLLKGRAVVEEDFPLMRRLGPFMLEPSTYLLDNKWQYQRTRLPNNWLRRIPAIYQLAQVPALADNYVAVCNAILNAAFRPQLLPLDRDDEFLYWENWAPDFHPRLRRFCSTDLQVAAEAVESLVDRIRGREPPPEPRIKGVPERMAESFIGLYERIIRRLEGLLASQPENSAAIQAQIDEYQRKIDTLEQFLAELRQGDGGNPNGN